MKNTNCPSHFAFYPAVYAVEKNYQILIPVRSPSVMWISVGDRTVYDAVGGVMRSGTLYHKISVPMEVLDREKEYTVHWREVGERRAYFSVTGEETRHTFAFRPVAKTGSIRICHISDAHGRVEAPVRAAWTAVREETPEAETVTDGLDLVVFTGDLPNHTGDEEQLRTVPAIASALTHGEIPIVSARGNHDTRGAFAEHLPEVSPSLDGRFYYTFRLGRIWGLVLDCGEDKPDDHAEYGNVNCFSEYRREEDRFLDRIIEEKEYLADGITTRLVLCHNPFPFPRPEPFDIERDIYARWAKQIGSRIRPDLMISGHLHVTEVCLPGCARDKNGLFCLGQLCPVFLSGSFTDAQNPADYICGALTLNEDGSIRTRFAGADGAVREETKLYEPPDAAWSQV